MLTCVPRSKHPDEHDGSNRFDDTPSGKQSTKTLTSQIKDMALKASDAYRSCTPCAGPTKSMTPQQQLQRSNYVEPESPESVSERFRRAYRRTGSKNSTSGRMWGKEMEARLRGISMGSDVGGESPATASGRRYEPIVLVEEIEPKEWVAQVEPGVLITFVRCRAVVTILNESVSGKFLFREIFKKWQAQRWWQENFDKVMELYNVRRLNRQAFPLPTPLSSEDELPLNSRSSKVESIDESPLASTMSKERLPRTIQSDHQGLTMMRSNSDSLWLAVTPKLSSIGVTKTKTSSLDASISANSTREVDHSGELSISKVSDVDNEWVEQDEPGVYITIKVLPGGSRELRRARFSREKFGEMHARLWWEENRARIQKQYL